MKQFSNLEHSSFLCAGSFLDDFKRANDRGELFDQFQRCLRPWDIKRNDDWIVHKARIKPRTEQG